MFTCPSIGRSSVLAVLISLLLAPTAQAVTVPQAGKVQPLSIVYTAEVGGVTSLGSSSFNEIWPLLVPEYKREVSFPGLDFDTTVLRHDGWYLCSKDKPSTARDLERLIQHGLQIDGAGIQVPSLYSDYVSYFELPGTTPWGIDWLADKNKDDARLPDLSLGKGTMFRLKAPADGLLLFSKDGTVPPPAVLRDPLVWDWSVAGHLPLKRGVRETKVIGFGRRFGGPQLSGLAAFLRDRLHAIRVDAGNLVDDMNTSYASFLIDDSLAEIGRMGLDALVPALNELRLSPERLRQLGERVPLVACNLQGPDGMRVRPYVVAERAGVRVGIVGLTDTLLLRQYGALGRRTGWTGEDPKPALERALQQLKGEAVDTIVLVTNLEGERLLKLREQAVGVSAIICSQQPRREATFQERYEPQQPERTRNPRPWLMAGAAYHQVGHMTLGFRDASRAVRPGEVPLRSPGAHVLGWIENEVQTVTNDLPEPDPKANWERAKRLDEHLANRRDSLLPDVRALSTEDKRLVDEEGDPLAYMEARSWSRLVASTIREASGAELAIFRSLYKGSTTVGEVTRAMAEEWLPREDRVALVTLSGAQIKRLMALYPDRDSFVLAGYDPKRQLIGGRPLEEEELYQVATLESLATSEAYQAIIEAAPRTELRVRGERIVPGVATDSVTLYDVVMARLEGMRARHGGFDEAYATEFKGLLLDDGQAVEPRWTLQLKPIQGSFQQFSVSNRTPFGSVRNSQINTPDNTAFGGKGNVALTYETADVDWESRIGADYQKVEFDAGGQSIVQEQNDEANLSSEFRLKFIQLQIQRTALSLIPFVNAEYQTEFTPTVDQEAGVTNPRRQELSGIAGVVLYPKTWLKEIRLGAIAKNDLAVATGKFEPGVQLAGVVEQPLGPLTLAIEADLKNYFLTPEDTAADLGFLGKVGAGLQFPLWGGFGLRVGADALFFTGKVAATRSLGTSLTPSIGIVYNATWKPLVGLVY